ncbi:MAG TPA: hypothetical protein ENN87_08870, partial [Phycisphaerales bacterium]|nr:hypothetical protein [Phycisphaerales bacterium]
MSRRTSFLASGVFLVFLTAATVGDVADHVFFIEIEMTRWHHEQPASGWQTAYGFWFEIDTDATVQRVEVLTPAGRTFEILPLEDYYNPSTGAWSDYDYDEDEDLWDWEYHHKFDAPEALHDFHGDGWYRVTVIYAGGGWDQTMVWFGVPGTQQFLDQPTQQAVFIHPQHRASVDSPVTFQWEPCTDPAVRVLW